MGSREGRAVPGEDDIQRNIYLSVIISVYPRTSSNHRTVWQVWTLDTQVTPGIVIIPDIHLSHSAHSDIISAKLMSDPGIESAHFTMVRT